MPTNVSYYNNVRYETFEIIPNVFKLTTVHCKINGVLGLMTAAYEIF
jgi:hypothetical protein